MSTQEETKMSVQAKITEKSAHTTHKETDIEQKNPDKTLPVGQRTVNVGQEDQNEGNGAAEQVGTYQISENGYTVQAASLTNEAKQIGSGHILRNIPNRL